MEYIPKILIVDDDIDHRTIIRKILEAKKYIIYEASNAYSALNKIEENMPDLVLLDIMMLGPDGLDVLQRIREKNPSYSNMRVVMVSSMPETSAKEWYRKKMGGKFVQDYDAFLEKPIDDIELLTTIERLLKPIIISKRQV